MPKHYENEMIQRAKDLRNNMTREECRLWYDFLRDYPVKFTRQEVIGYYVVDFYCPKLKLAIEVDGRSHFTEQGLLHDKYRTEYLEHHHGAVTVVRFLNLQINERFDEVCKAIDEIVKEMSEE